MQRVLITGAAGFVGRHLADYLASKGSEVWALDCRAPVPRPARGGRVRVRRGDIGRPAWLRRVLAEARPDVVFHLAGVLKAAEARDLYQVHVLGTVALFEAIVDAGLAPIVLLASSSAVYGPGEAGRPITERTPLRPLTHYGVSKLAQEAVALRYHRACGVPVVVTRTFNLLGPGQSPELACSAFSRQIARAERAGRAAVVHTGSLEARRDFTDVRDAVRAYNLVVRKGRPGEVYNVCSGKAVSIRQCLDIELGMARVPLEVATDPGRARGGDVPLQVGSARKLRARTGWKPRIPLRESLADLLNHWRQNVQSERGARS